jgi:hypothetical protein
MEPIRLFSSGKAKVRILAAKRWFEKLKSLMKVISDEEFKKYVTKEQDNLPNQASPCTNVRSYPPYQKAQLAIQFPDKGEVKDGSIVPVMQRIGASVFLRSYVLDDALVI